MFSQTAHDEPTPLQQKGQEVDQLMRAFQGQQTAPPTLPASMNGGLAQNALPIQPTHPATSPLGPVVQQIQQKTTAAPALHQTAPQQSPQHPVQPRAPELAANAPPQAPNPDPDELAQLDAFIKANALKEQSAIFVKQQVALRFYISAPTLEERQKHLKTYIELNKKYGEFFASLGAQ